MAFFSFLQIAFCNIKTGQHFKMFALLLGLGLGQFGFIDYFSTDIFSIL